MAIPISPEFVEKYNQPGPRYTSYPTVPAWTEPFGETEYRIALEELADRPGDELALYLHLPFCAKHCLYCGCNALVTRETDAVDRYLDLVEKEIGMVTGIIGTGRHVVQMHWGGGTPNYLKEPQLERALNLFRTAFDIRPGAEVSLEIDPRIGSPEQAAYLHSLGFNRISLGVQDFEPRVQEAIGRMQSREKTLRVYQGCRDAGFEGVNIDLVYGLPGQTAESFTETLGEIIGLAPDRVACFSYAHVPWVRPEQEKIDTSQMLVGYEKFKLFQLTVDSFTAADYCWIGIDHFAKREDELSHALDQRALHRNFMGYATKPAPHMLAFGMSGIGDVCDRFAQNDPDLQNWSRAVAEGRLPIVKGHRLNDDDRLRRLVILNIMCNLELPWSLTEKEFGAPANELLADSLAALPPLVADGLAEVDDHGLRITPKGRYFVRNVAMIMDAYLSKGKGRPIFSKTV
ncbi:oxygen-independent coproporphyrinogen III oxidase [bacterium CG_4_9_14_3_um_filter_65_15]|nr:MAG: oxygen-independent coproporphyrinogen III oxidase [bacterium CG_4_9_14_3_um_filter_65_15]